MIRLVQDIVSYAAGNNIEDRGSFVKETFRPDFDVRSLNRVDLSGITDSHLEKKANKNLYLQLDEYIHSKDQNRHYAPYLTPCRS